MRLFGAASAVACFVAIGACTETTSNPVALSSPGRLNASLVNRPLSHPNSEKYRDTGYHPATARGGSSVVSARALLDKAGTTDVEVTTGTFDDGAAPGTLRRVQVKAFTPSGKLAFTNDYAGGSASATFPYTTLPHGTALQLQTVVDGIDVARSDVDTLATAVYFRPDLVASRLDAPAGAPVGAAVNLEGLITERNGEIGARADCVLYVDGTAADRASGIWVDAGGTVACSMTHLFTEARTYSLELRVENVRPGDFDDTNNSVTTSISIAQPSDFTAYDFQAWAVTDSGWWHAVSTLTQWDGTVQTWDQIYTRQGTSQFASLNGIIPRMLDYTAPITLRGEMSTNGATVNSVDDTYPSLPWVDWQQGYCDYHYNFDTRGVTYICVHPEGPLAGYTHVQYDWSGADIHYTSDSYVYYWDPSGELHQAWYSEDYSDVGAMVTLGPDFSGRLSVQGVNDPEPFTAQATVSFAPIDLRFDYINDQCSTAPASPGCFELHDHTYGLMGWVAYGSWPPPTP
jgi:hypothetical protein